MPFCPAGLELHFTVPVFDFYCISNLTSPTIFSLSPPSPPSDTHASVSLAPPSHRNVSDPRGQGLGRRPRRRHGHHQRGRRPLRSRGQEGVLHLDKGRWRTWSGEERGGVEREGGRWRRLGYWGGWRARHNNLHFVLFFLFFFHSASVLQPRWRDEGR